MRNFTVQPTTVKVRHLLKVLLIILAVMFNQASSSLANANDTVGDTESPPIVIQSVNPGYTIDGQANADEYIELINLSLEPVSLSGIVLNYTNSSGNTSLLYEFPEGSIFSGEIILLRYAKSPEVISADKIIADDTYEKTLAFSGALSLEKDGQILSMVCWTGKDDCQKNFKSSNPTALVRTLIEDSESENHTYTHVSNYEILYNPELPGLSIPELEEEPDQPEEIVSCQGIIITEIYSYYDNDSSEQFIELYNQAPEDIDLSKCRLKYKTKILTLPEKSLEPEEYLAFYPSISLTKDPSSNVVVSIMDLAGNIVDEVTQPHGQKRAMSYAYFGISESGQSIWQKTYHVTPSAENVFQEYRSCPAGKVINHATGNCVNAPTITTAIEPCPAGKYRNPATGRCKKIEEDTTTECKPGYEKNPETNRCRKIKDNSPADYSLVPVTGTSEKSSFVAVGALVVVAILGLIYLVLQFRHEIRYFFVKIFKSKP